MACSRFRRYNTLFGMVLYALAIMQVISYAESTDLKENRRKTGTAPVLDRESNECDWDVAGCVAGVARMAGVGPKARMAGVRMAGVGPYGRGRTKTTE